MPLPSQAAPPSQKDSKVAAYATLFALLVFLLQYPAKITCVVMALVSPALSGSVSSLSYILATIYAASMLNVWLWNLIKHDQHMKGNRYAFSKLVKSTSFWLFIVDELVFLIPFLLLLYPIQLTTILVISAIFLVCNLASFYIIVTMDTLAHEPTFPGLDEQFVLKNKYEVAEMPDNQLSILQSDAYCIVLANIGTKPVEGNFKIIRTVAEESFDVRFTLAVPLLPGVNLKLVPEGKATEGAVELKGYLSFGVNRARKIETRIFIDGNSLPSVVKVETYELPAGAVKEYLDKNMENMLNGGKDEKK